MIALSTLPGAKQKGSRLDARLPFCFFVTLWWFKEHKLVKPAARETHSSPWRSITRRTR